MKDQIRNSILEPKKKQLIECLKKVVTGKEASYVFDYHREKHYQIWFYNPLDLNYIFIGDNNFTINISDSNDKKKLQAFRTIYELPDQIHSKQDFSDFIREIEFVFFADCWKELENELSIPLRCFLIEYGIIRGLDVNNRIKIDGEKIDGLLKK